MSLTIPNKDSQTLALQRSHVSISQQALTMIRGEVLCKNSFPFENTNKRFSLDLEMESANKLSSLCH